MNPASRMVGWMVAFVGAAGLFAGELELQSVLVSGGGGAGESPRFAMVGSVGQPLAGVGFESADGFKLRTGFWTQVTRWVNAVPQPGSDTLTRRPGDAAQILISRLLANDVDGDFDRLSFAGFSGATVGGGSVFRDGPWLIYQPPVGGDPETDTVTYLVTDGFGAPVAGQLQVVRYVPPYDGPPNALGIATDPANSNQVRVQFQGIAGRSYLVQTAQAITGPWQVLGPVVAGATGRMEVVDVVRLDPRFYRLVEP